MLTRFTNRWRVDNRHHFRDVLNHHAIKHSLVAFQQAREIDVPTQRRRRASHVAECPFGLFVDGEHARGNEAMQPVHVALFHGERATAVEVRIAEEVVTAQCRTWGHRVFVRGRLGRTG